MSGVAVCVFDATYMVTIDTTGAVTVSVRHCAGYGIDTCTWVLQTTGIASTGPVVTTVGSTTICVGICTSVPFTPLKVDTGYDVYVNGVKRADICVAVAATC